MSTGIVGGFTKPNSILAQAGAVVAAVSRFGSVNPPKITRMYQEMWGVGFRAQEIRIWSFFAIVPRNGEISSSDPQTPEPVNSPFRTRSPKRTSYIDSPWNFGVGIFWTWSPGAYIPRDKKSIVKCFRYYFQGGENTLFCLVKCTRILADRVSDMMNPNMRFTFISHPERNVTAF